MALTTLIAGIWRDLIRRLDRKLAPYRGLNAEIQAAQASMQFHRTPAEPAPERAD